MPSSIASARCCRRRCDGRHPGRRRLEDLRALRVAAAVRTLKSALVGGSLFRELKPEATFTAVENVSFNVAAGSTVAMIGPNGSGKSTLLKLVAGVLKPTSGRIVVQGRTAALLELGTGFHPEVSGRENAIINGMMLGLTRREIERKLPEIARFAEIGEFIEAPVKTYSSGMYARLAFAVAFAVEPDVLLVDEILAVGDEAFGNKCLDRFHDFKRRGKTIVFVTHGLTLAENLADTVLLHGGRPPHRRGHAARGRGPLPWPRPRPARRSTLAEVNDAQRSQEEAKTADARRRRPTARWPEGRTCPTHCSRSGWGSGMVEIAEVVLRAKDGTPTELFQTGDPILLDLDVVAHEPQGDFVFGFAVRGRDGHLAYGTNTAVEGYIPRHLVGRARYGSSSRRSRCSMAATRSTSRSTGGTASRSTTATPAASSRCVTRSPRPGWRGSSTPGASRATSRSTAPALSSDHDAALR